MGFLQRLFKHKHPTVPCAELGVPPEIYNKLQLQTWRDSVLIAIEGAKQDGISEKQLMTAVADALREGYDVRWPNYKRDARDAYIKDE